MSNTLILGKSYVNVGLDTMTYTIPTGTVTQTYNVKVSVTNFPASGVTIVVNQNGSPIFTAPTLGQTQTALQFKYSFIGVAADVITVVLSSSVAEDALLNSVQSIISIGQGQ